MDNRGAINLHGRRALITGVSRASGIGAAIARRFAQSGAAVALHGYSDYDLKMRYADARAGFAAEWAEGLAADGHVARALHPCDLAEPGAAETVVAEANQQIGTLSDLVLNHAFSTNAPLGAWTAEHIDAHLLVNVRASMLMIQAFAQQIDPAIGGAVTLFTSGQYLGPMVEEIAYAVSKDALIGLCRQASHALVERNIRVNCINPGPNDTGYLSGEAYDAVARRFPAGRWGMPDDAADLLLFLHSEYARWITGQVIASEGGFRRG